MKAYDTVVIINLSQGDEKVAETISYIEKAIEGFSGKVSNIEKWGKRLLAYPIKKCSEGFYALVKFELDTENIAKFKGKLRLNEMIIREMTLVEQPYFAPPVFSQAAPAEGEAVAEEGASEEESADKAGDAETEEAAEKEEGVAEEAGDKKEEAAAEEADAAATEEAAEEKAEDSAEDIDAGEEADK